MPPIFQITFISVILGLMILILCFVVVQMKGMNKAFKTDEAKVDASKRPLADAKATEADR